MYVWNAHLGTNEAFLAGYGEVRKVPELEETLPFYEFFNYYGGVAWAVRRGQESFLQENVAGLQARMKTLRI
jgi:hypothetical protein